MRHDIDNYRLISILPIMSKILKKAVQHQLSDYLEKASLISIFQCSFRPRYSAQSAITYLIAQREEIWIIDVLHPGAIFTDFRKDFDTIYNAVNSWTN